MFSETKSSRGRVNVELDLSIYTAKVELKKCNKCWYIKTEAAI